MMTNLCQNGAKTFRGLVVVNLNNIASREHIPTEMLDPKLDGTTASGRIRGKATVDGASAHDQGRDGIAATHPGTKHEDLGTRDLGAAVKVKVILGISRLIQGP